MCLLDVSFNHSCCFFSFFKQCNRTGNVKFKNESTSFLWNKSSRFFKMLFFSVSHMQLYSLYSIQVNFNVIMSSVTEISWLLFLPSEGPDKEHS